MAIAYVNLTLAVYGNVVSETALNLRRFEVEVQPEVREVLPDFQNLGRGFAIGDPMSTVTIEGEVNGSTGIFALDFATAFTPANEIDWFGGGVGGLYLMKATVTTERAGWQSLNATLESRAGIT